LQQTDLTAIYSSGQHLLGLINDILDLSKIEAGKMELNFDQVDVRPIVKGVMSTAVGLVKDKPIELEHDVAEDLPIIWADSTRVRQVLLNLISNATKFTENGKIRLEVDAEPQGANESGSGWITIRVSDTGVGIPAEKLDSIFEEFTQVDGSTTRSVGGTGLGLPISRHFVEMHGGTIRAESQEGVGSTFTIRLPIHGPASDDPQAPPTTDEGRSKSATGEGDQPSEVNDRPLILAVDNDAGVISLYRRYLDGEGYRVIGVTDSTTVVEKAIELQPFAITLDILMPGKDGWQVLRELKEHPETRHIPIVICSIVSNEGLGFSLGAADYLVKPIMEEELVAALASLAERNQTDGQEATVLIIDDQADDVLLIRRILEAQNHSGPGEGGSATQGGGGTGYRVIEASGGQAGIDLVHEHRPDIILLDLMMPEVDGFAVLEALKRDPSTRNIPVVVITAKELGEEERERLMGQAEVLLHKGVFTEHELLEDLKDQISKIKAI
jgi:CheY-like chemotaxis protein